jgi:hypothetical protein
MPEFVEIFHAAFKAIAQLIRETPPAENDDAGMLVQVLMVASKQDFDDIMLLCSHDRHWGALRLLRVLFERTVTLKYIAKNPTEAQNFIGYDAMDWQPILSGIEKRYGIKSRPETLTHLESAIKNLPPETQEKCKECKKRKQTTWTPRTPLELAQKTGLEYLYLEAYSLPNKLIHPTLFGTGQVSSDGPTPLRNILIAMHALAVETLLTHERFFKRDPLTSSLAQEAVRGFFRVWKYSDSDFGLGKELERLGIPTSCIRDQRSDAVPGTSES